MITVEDLPPELQAKATPFLAVDVRTVAANLDRAQAFATRAGLSLRPHAKTHKVAELAAMQVAAGAHGLTVSSLGEAEAFAARAFDDLFIAYSVPVTAEAAKRIALLLEQTKLSIAVDSIEGAEALAAHGLGAQSGLGVMVEVNVGLDRSGVRPARAAQIGRRAVDLGLQVDGVFAYPGHGYAAGAAGEAATDERRLLSAAAEAFAELGLDVRVVSGGSTPTLYASREGILNEIRPGVYALNDAQQVALQAAQLDDVALFAVSTVISVPEPGRYVLDAGSKCLASDRPPFVDGHGRVLGSRPATITRIWEHHAVVTAGDAAGTGSKQGSAGKPGPRVGDRVLVVPNHVCTAINLQREIYAFDNNTIEPWPLIAGQTNN